jgi:amidophosphoribosyltransferase
MQMDFIEKQMDLTDSRLMHLAIEHLLEKGLSLEDAIKETFPLFTGAFSLLVMTKDKIAAVRDAYGIRPFSIGTINGSGLYFFFGDLRD